MPPRRPARHARASFARLRATALLATLAAACGTPAPRPNIILVTLDTTRADHLGCYGHTRDTSPNLDRLAAEALRYTRAYSTASWTLPAHASLFTGKFTTSHGARYDPEGPLALTRAIAGPAEWSRYRVRGLDADEMTLATVLREHGWATGGVVAGPWLKRVFGLGAGFEHWDDDGITDTNGRPASEVTDAAIEWIEAHRAGPFFLFLNYFDPHAPYAPPPAYAQLFLPPGAEGGPRTTEVRQALYDAEIRYADAELGRLLARLRALGLYDEAWIIVTADHGDLLGGRGGRFGHGKTLTEAEIRVPLVVKLPASARRTGTVDTLVQVVDVVPMLLAALGIPPPAGIQGGPPPNVGHPVVAEVYPLPMLTQGGDWQALVDGRWKLARSSQGARQLFDLAADPDEARDLAAADPARAAALDAELTRYLASLPAPRRAGSAGAVDAETQRALKSLGYTD